jgi:hypothetical protein
MKKREFPLYYQITVIMLFIGEMVGLYYWTGWIGFWALALVVPALAWVDRRWNLTRRGVQWVMDRFPWTKGPLLVFSILLLGAVALALFPFTLTALAYYYIEGRRDPVKRHARRIAAQTGHDVDVVETLLRNRLEQEVDGAEALVNEAQALTEGAE